jgi:signal transduction histidine kinase
MLCKWLIGPWTNSILKLPFFYRIGICAVSCALCIALYYSTFSFVENGSMFLAIPMLFASWTFGKYGACLCLGLLVGFELLCVTFLAHNFWFSPVNIFSFSYSAFMLCLEGCLMVSLRGIVDAEERARLAAERAQQQWNDAYERQRQLNQLKDQFLLNVNHELRTPLAATYGYLEMLQLMLEEQGSLEKIAHISLFKKALSYCDELRSSVNNVLDTIAIGGDKGELEREMLVLHDVFQDVIHYFRSSKVQNYRFCLDVPPQLRVYANAQCLRHIMYHLLSNAFKYAPAQSLIVVCAIAHPVSGQIIVTVRDEGPGIAPEELDLLFGRFVRLPRDLGGTVRGIGLGLYICKHLVELMDGQIWVESRGIAGLGSCFRFTLPVLPESAPVITLSLPIPSGSDHLVARTG